MLTNLFSHSENRTVLGVRANSIASQLIISKFDSKVISFCGVITSLVNVHMILWWIFYLSHYCTIF